MVGDLANSTANFKDRRMITQKSNSHGSSKIQHCQNKPFMQSFKRSNNILQNLYVTFELQKLS